MAGLINLVPRYLPRFGMAPRWVSYRRPMVLALCGIDVIVTLIFGGSVEKQGGAYATGVLALILSAAVAVTLSKWREFSAESRSRHLRLPMTGYFLLVSCVFAYTMIANVFERPDGVVISAIFIFLVLLLSGISRICDPANCVSSTLSS
jgi:membrane protease YdiL (CAAX protease family)